MSNDSAMTIMPSESYTSICICEGILWLVRMASAPMRFMMTAWRMMAPLLTAAPNGPKSWCKHTPLIFRVTPLS